MDLIFDVAAIRNPLPRPGEVAPEECFPDAFEQAEKSRREDADRLEAASDGLGEDPLLLALQDARARKEEADQMIRLLLAYGREFLGHRPYGLERLHRASGYSVSGVRTAYGADEIDAVAREVGRQPDRRSTAGRAEKMAGER